jgi:hypothetical protein
LNYSAVLIFDTINEMNIPKIPIKAKENCNPKASATYPIIGGPIKKPRKLTLETAVKASPVGISGCFPAILYNVGMIVETPNPTNINAMVHGIK